jgi:dolichol-phosphate mannosyltransferase
MIIGIGDDKLMVAMLADRVGDGENEAMLSVVVPIFNEQENLPELHRRMVSSLEATGMPWEVVLVNDGSRDRSLEVLRQIHAADGRFKVVSLSRNFGHQPAVSAGIHHARGDAVVLIDGDLQDPPEVIVDLVRAWQAGVQVVVAERRTRADAGVRGIGFRLFYPVMRRLTELPNVPDAGIFCLMDREVVAEFNRLPERNRFIPGLRLWLGFRQGTVQYDRQERAAGKPKQTFRRLLNYAMNGIVSFSYRPLRLATYTGFVVTAFGFLTACYFVIKRLRGDEQAVTGFTTLLCAIVFMGGVQLICVGILGEYIGRIYEEVKQRPLYVVGERLGVEKPSVVVERRQLAPSP